MEPGSSRRQKVRATTPEEQPLPSPKRTRKTAAAAKPEPSPPVLSPGAPKVDDDAKSVKSKASDKTMATARSNTGSAKIRQLQNELEAKRRLHELEKELLIKERDAIKEELRITKAIAAEKAREAHEPEDRHPPEPVAPPADKNELIKRWVANEPLTQAEHPYAASCELGEINSCITKLLARQAVPRDLPFFSGEPTEWYGFISQFENTTKACGLSNAENMLRLNKSLTSKAREAVAPMLNIPENVPLVIETLRMLFGRPNLIVKSLVEKTKNLSNVTESNPETIIAFANAVNNLVSTMKSLKFTGHISNPTLMEELLGKLPPSLQLQWCVQNKKSDADLEVFSTWIMSIAVAATSMPAASCSRTLNNDSRQPKKQVLNNNDSKSSSEKPKCPKCSEPHWLFKCPQFRADSIEERWNFVALRKLCFSCLRSGHQTSSCPMKRQCGLQGCKLPHNSMLHRPDQRMPDQINFCDGTKEVMLRILPVKLTGPNGTVRVYALLDDGSTVTMMDRTIALQLGLTGPKRTLCIQWTNKMVQTDENSELISCQISGAHEGAKNFRLKDVRTISSLDLACQTVDAEALKSRWRHLSKLPIASFRNAKPSLIIGEDNILLTIPRSVRHAGWNDPVASKTWLGWTVHGSSLLQSMRSKRVDRVLISHECDNEKEVELNDLIKGLFSLDAFGIKPDNGKVMTKNDVRALEILKNTVKRVGTRFEAGLLWASDDISMPVGSKQTALHRLFCVEKRMDRDPKFAELYCSKMEEYLEKGYAKKLTAEEAMIESNKTFYIPHFAVTNVNKPGKIRLVFDAAAKTQNFSLNDALISGPDLLNDLPAVLWRFRQHRIGFTSDVKEMFNRVLICDADTDAQRFLWRGRSRHFPPQTYIMKAMIFGSKCSPTTATYVMRQNAADFATDFPEVNAAVTRNYYVDDYCHGADNEDEAIQLILNIIEVQRRGGFEIRNWICSSRQVLAQIPQDLIASSFKELTSDKALPVERVLGLWWDAEKDKLTFRLNEEKLKLITDASQVWTKRSVLKLMASIFDPLGLIAHLMVKARLIFQQAHRINDGWDVPLADSIRQKWELWRQQLPKISQVSVSRFYGQPPSAPGPILHVFCDASTEAYCTVAYLRWGEEDCLGLSLVAAKARVAPSKPLTVPRLELMAALLAARLADKIRKEHDYTIRGTIFWTDSSIALCWIRSDAGKFNQFVSARVADIQELSDPSQWHWVPTADNPADDGTRLDKPADLCPTSRWYSGPAFLLRPPDEWPIEKASQSLHTDEMELRAKFVGAVVGAKSDAALPDLNRFSSWTRLIRTTAWVIRFATNLRMKRRRLNDLDAFDIADAEMRWIKTIQAQTFAEEIENLKLAKPVAKSSRLYTLFPMLDENNVLRVRGRTAYSDLLDYQTKYPIILDGKHPWTRLLILHYHQQSLHMGIEAVINNLRAKYWVTNLRATVKLVSRSCQWCKIRMAKPMQPEMAPLPDCRVNSSFIPFDHTGIDFFGPYYVRVTPKTVQKRYGVLFTCLAVRAIHIELASSISTDATIMAIRRFMSRRGVQPSHIYTDCGTNFRGSSPEIREAIMKMNRQRLEDEFAAKLIEWHYNPPASPNMGGSWESLIKSVKRALDAAILARRYFNTDVLETAFTEVMFTVNSRPLTEVSVDPKDQKALTPNDFIHVKSMPVPSWTSPFDTKHLKRFWRLSQILANTFWQRWLKEYLPTLTQRHKWHDGTPNIKIGDLVVLVDGTYPRNTWPRGKIVQVYPGRDGKVRVVDVTTESGTYRRPVSKLAKLDVKRDEED